MCMYMYIQQSTSVQHFTLPQAAEQVCTYHASCALLTLPCYEVAPYYTEQP